jgi:hypothetical protein
MNPRVWFGYLFGQGKAIQAVAESRQAIWTGIGLVLLTAIARNYDQTFIGEKPFLWLFGSLLFSVVSGTWLYAVVYGWFVRRSAGDANGKPEFWGRWRTFMALFWMTAPVAWLYAIPVERFFDSLTAAKANLALLGIVSLWRVLLMTRVIQYLTGARWYAVLLWVLFAAAIEILVVFFFGGAFAKALMEGMGGMRNSPEEHLILNALGAVLMGAFWGAPAVLIAALLLGRSGSVQDLPIPSKANSSFGWLMIFAVLWLAVAVQPQRELIRTVHVEKLIAAKNYRAALDYMTARQPTDFAPARVLAPNAFEREIFTDLPACFGVVQADDPAWVQAHLMRRFHQMLTHYTARWERKKTLSDYSYEDQVKHVAYGLSWYGPDAAGMNLLLDGLERMPEGNEWLARNAGFVAAVCVAVAGDSFRQRERDKTEAQKMSDLLSLSNRLHSLGGTNFSDMSVKP